MTKWITPAPYFGPFFGSGAGIVPGQMSATLHGTSSLTASLTFADATTGETDQTKFGGGGIYPRLGSTAGAGLHVPYRHKKPVDEFGYEIDLPIVPDTPLAQPSAPIRASIDQETADLSLILGPHPAPVEVLQVSQTLQTKTGPTPDEVLKAKHNNHALRLLLLAS